MGTEERDAEEAAGAREQAIEEVRTLFAKDSKRRLRVADCPQLVALIRSFLEPDAAATIDDQALEMLVVAALKHAEEQDTPGTTGTTMLQLRERNANREGARGFLFLPREVDGEDGMPRSPQDIDLVRDQSPTIEPYRLVQRRRWAAIRAAAVLGKRRTSPDVLRDTRPAVGYASQLSIDLRQFLDDGTAIEDEYLTLLFKWDAWHAPHAAARSDQGPRESAPLVGRPSCTEEVLRVVRQLRRCLLDLGILLCRYDRLLADLAEIEVENRELFQGLVVKLAVPTPTAERAWIEWARSHYLLAEIGRTPEGRDLLDVIDATWAVSSSPPNEELELWRIFSDHEDVPWFKVSSLLASKQFENEGFASFFEGLVALSPHQDATTTVPSSERSEWIWECEKLLWATLHVVPEEADSMTAIMADHLSTTGLFDPELTGEENRVLRQFTRTSGRAHPDGYKELERALCADPLEEWKSFPMEVGMEDRIYVCSRCDSRLVVNLDAEVGDLHRQLDCATHGEQMVWTPFLDYPPVSSRR